jgi:hypothetical protein
MFLDGQRKSKRERFFGRSVTRRRGFSLRHNDLSGFSRLGGRHLERLRFGHAAGFVSVPRPTTDLKARPPRGGRESDHPNQQEHGASDKKLPVMRDDWLHVFVEDSPKRAVRTSNISYWHRPCRMARCLDVRS